MIYRKYIDNKRSIIDKLKKVLLITAYIVWVLLFEKQNEVKSAHSVYILFGLTGFVCNIFNVVYKDKINYIFENNKNLLYIKILKLLFGLICLIGNYEVFQNMIALYGILAAVFVYFFAGHIAVEIAVRLSYIQKNYSFFSEKRQINIAAYSVAAFLIMTVWYLAVFFSSVFPGDVCGDSITQIGQIIRGDYSNHHPFYHTMLIKIFYDIGMKAFNGNINKSIALFNIFQIILMSAVFAYSILTLLQMKINKWLVSICCLFYVIMPFHIKSSFNMWKDTVFSIGILLFIISLWRVIKNIGREVINEIILAISCVGFCILRSNGLIAFIITILFFVLIYGVKNRKVLYIFVGSLMVGLLLKYPVLKILDVEQPDFIESLSIPAQQIARVVRDFGDLTDDERALLQNIVEVDSIGEEYHAEISDYIKNLVRRYNNQEFLSEHKSDYFKLWINLGMRHPYTYIKAWADQTDGYWNCRNYYWNVWWRGIPDNDFGIVQTINNEKAAKILNGYLELFETKQAFKIFLNIGLYVWIIVIVCFAGLLNDNKKYFLMIPVLSLVATLLLATPMCHEFRYAYYIFVCFPFLIYIEFAKDDTIAEAEIGSDKMEKMLLFSVASKTNLESKIKVEKRIKSSLIFNYIKKWKKSGAIWMLLIFLGAALVSELFIFNFRHWQTMFNKPYECAYNLDDGYSDNGDGTYAVVDGSRDIEITDIPFSIKNIYVELDYVNDEFTPLKDAIEVVFYATDEGNSGYYEMNSRKIYKWEERSRYFQLYPYGKIKSLKLVPFLDNEMAVEAKIVLNPKVPIFFEAERVIFVFGLLCIIWVFKPASVIYKIKYKDIKDSKRWIFIGLFVAVNFFIFYRMSRFNDLFFYNNTYETHKQYAELAKSFKEGHTYLPELPSDELINMENPYDSVKRGELEVPIKWDTAYFNGKYYVYFGVTPVVLFYYPYYLISGKEFPNYYACLISIFIITLSIPLILDEMIKKYYKKCSIGIWIISAELLLMGSYVFFAANHPDIYVVPRTCGLGLGMLGMWSFMKSISNKKKEAGLNNKYLLLGSLMTALVVGCRPQLFLFFVLDIIIMRKYIFSWEYIKTKDGTKSFIAVATPMMVVAVFLMVYNAVRFGSPFDFGDKYNLTVSDLTHRGTVLGRLPVGLIVYLLRPLELAPEYPYFAPLIQKTKYMGMVTQAPTFGGIFMAFPFSFMVIAAFFFRKNLKKKSNNLWLLSISAFFIALLIASLDVIRGGIFPGYCLDFAFLFTFSALCATWGLLQIREIKGTIYNDILIKVVVGIMIFEMFYLSMSLLLDEYSGLIGRRKDLFYHYYYLFGFGF